MTQEQQADWVGNPARAQHQAYRPEPAPTKWVGWVIFAAIVMFTVGCFNALAGFVALLNDDFYMVSSDGLLIHVDYSVWGWAFLIYGFVVAIAGLGVMTGKTWARAIGVVLAVLNALFNLMFLGAYPIWTTMVIALDVIVIFALVVHGREARALS